MQRMTCAHTSHVVMLLLCETNLNTLNCDNQKICGKRLGVSTLEGRRHHGLRSICSCPAPTQLRGNFDQARQSPRPIAPAIRRHEGLAPASGRSPDRAVYCDCRRKVFLMSPTPSLTP